MLVPLTASAHGGGGGGQQGQHDQTNNYESYCVTIDDTGDTTGIITGPTGDYEWLAWGTYNVNVELTTDGKQIHYWYTNNGNITQSGYLDISLADGYSATAIQSIENQGTNSQAAMYDNSDVHVKLVTVKNDNGDVVPAYANGKVDVYLVDSNGNNPTYQNTYPIFTNVLVDGKSTYTVNPNNYIPEGYELATTDGDSLSGVIDGDKTISLYYKEKVVEKKNITVKYVDEFNNVLKDSEIIHTGNKDSSYDVSGSITAPSGYEVVETTGDATNGTLDTDKNITVVCKANNNYTVNFWLWEGDKTIKNTKLQDSITGTIDINKFTKDPATGEYVNYLVDIDGKQYSTPEKYSLVGSISTPSLICGTRYDYNKNNVVLVVNPRLFMSSDVNNLICDLYFAPKSRQGLLTVNFVDEDGNTIADPNVINKKYNAVDGWTYNVDPSEYSIDGYTFKEVRNDSGNLTDTVYENTNVVINLVYTQDMEHASVKVNFVDKTTGEALSDPYVASHTWAVKPKDSSQFKPKYKFSDSYSSNTTTIEITSNGIINYEFPGYSLVETDVKDFTPENEGEYEFTYYLERVNYNVALTINFEDIFGNKIADSYTIKDSFEYGDKWSYTVDPDTYGIEGYAYRTHKGELSVSTEVTNEFEVTLVYAPLYDVDITINYIDSTTGESIKHSDNPSSKVEYKDTFKIDIATPEILKYRFTNADGELHYDFQVEEDFTATVTLYYVPITQYVRVVDDDGAVINDYVPNYISTDECFKDAKSIEELVYNTVVDEYIPEGYEFFTYEGDSPEGVLDVDKYVTIVVKKQIHGIIINVEDRDGNLLDSDERKAEHNDPYVVDTDKYIPDGYELVEVKGETSGKLDTDKEVTIVVKKQIHTITVEVIDEDGNLIDNDKITGDHGNDYKVDTDKYIPDGYELVEVKGETSGKLDDDTTITLVVKKKVVKDKTPVKNNKPEEPADNNKPAPVKTGDTGNVVVATAGTSLIALAALVAALKKRFSKK